MEFIEKTNVLTEQIDNLENKLNTLKIQKEVLDIINGLSELEEGPVAGYNAVITSLEVSRKAMEQFIQLLEGVEYIKTYSNGSNGFGTQHTRTNNFEIYYLTFGKGIILELEFIEHEYLGYKELSDFNLKKSFISANMYIDLNDYTIKVTSERGDFKAFRILNANGNEIFSTSEIKDNYIDTCDGKSVSQVIAPISIEELRTRFMNKFKNEDTKKAPRLEQK